MLKNKNVEKVSDVKLALRERSLKILLTKIEEDKKRKALIKHILDNEKSF